MKRLLLVALCFISIQSFAQLIDAFNYSGALNANGWTTHSGATPGQLVTNTTPSDLGNSLNYAGLPTPVGNRAMLVSGNTEDVNIPVTGITGKGYFSFLLNVRNTTGLTAAGDHFFGFAANAGSTGVTNFAARIWIKSGSVAGTFQIGIINSGSTGSYYSQDYPVGTTIMVVASLDNTTSPNSTAQLWINPTPGSVEPVPFITSNSGATVFPTFASVYIRQGSAATGNLDLDEIRVGSTWASVTPSSVVSCNTTATISASACTSYTVPSGDETYFASGTYMDTIPNAALCDSIITINLTINNNTTSTISPSACISYTVPSGDETYFASGTYMDTIPNANGCDSVITINLTIVTSITYYQDFDTDGFGNPAVTQAACSPPVGYVLNSDDCNDNDNMIGVATTWYHDMDGDGYGNPSMSTTACTAPGMYVANNTDCNDANPAQNPGATDIPDNGTDEDCSGSDSLTVPVTLGQYEFTGNVCGTNPVLGVTTQPANATFSLYEVVGGQTCSQANNTINYSDWNQTGAINPGQYYGFTVTPAACYSLSLSELHFTQRASSGAPNVIVRSSLDNFTADIYTGTVPNNMTPVTVTLPAQFATIYDAVEFRFYITTMGSSGATYRHDDVSVTGNISALPTLTFYADSDGDTYGDAASTITDCVPPAGYVTDNTDCNDNNAAEHPGAMWAIDNDADGFAGATTMMSCTQPVGYISDTAAVDCDDNNNAIQGQITYYADTDSDGFGDLNNPQDACSQPVGFVTNSTDCDDTDNSVGAASIQYFFDADFDGYGDPNNFFYGCSIQVGYATNDDDCDDSNPAVNPDAIEICDGLDNNCNNDIDEGADSFTWYADTDNDGLGDPSSSVQDCTQPNGFVGNDDDCDDTDPTPNAGETVFYPDVDNDNFGDNFNAISACTAPNGYISVGGDCNDNNAAINPNATDVAGNSIDENCDGVDGDLSVDEDAFFSLSAFPNPGTDKVILKISDNFGVQTVEVISIDGKVVGTAFTKVENGYEVNTSELKTGVYMIRVTNGFTARTINWVKQ